MLLRFQADPENPKYVLLYTEEILWKRVYKSLFIRHLRALCQIADKQQLQEAFLQLEAKVAKKCAFDLLSKKSYLSSELQRKLEERGLSLQVIKRVLAECQSAGYLNDRRQLVSLIEKEMRKGKGHHFIFAKLRAKGIASEEIAQELSKLDLDPEKQIRALIHKYRSRYSLSDPLEKRKLIAFLQRRGFDLQAIFDALQ